MRVPAILFPWQGLGCSSLIKFGRGNKSSAVTKQWRGWNKEFVASRNIKRIFSDPLPT